MNFDETIKRLEEISNKMDNEDLTLDESIKLYDDGMKLSKECIAELNNLNGKIFVIRQDMEKFKEMEVSKEKIDETK